MPRAGLTAIDTDVLTTRAFLELAERRVVIASAKDYWQRIAEVAPTAKPDITITMQRRPVKGSS